MLLCDLLICEVVVIFIQKLKNKSWRIIYLLGMALYEVLQYGTTCGQWRM